LLDKNSRKSAREAAPLLLICVAFTFLEFMAQLSGGSSTLDANAQDRGESEQSLELNRPAARDISSQQEQRFIVSAEANQFIDLMLRVSGIRLRASLYDSEGRMVLQTACDDDSPTHISWIATRSANYRLRITGCESESVAGHYETGIVEMRSMTEYDPDLVAARMAMIEAKKLRAALDITANRQAGQTYQQALSLARKAGDASTEAEILRSIGEMFQEWGEKQAGIRFFQQGLASSRKAKDSNEESRILSDICFLQAMGGEYKNALNACSTALELSRANRNPQNEARALSNTGVVYDEQGEVHRVLEYEQAALRISQQLQDRRGQAQALLRAGYANVNLGEIQAALDAYQRALPLFQAVGDYRGQAYVLAAFGHLHSRTGNKQEALNYYSKAMALSQQMENPFLRAELCAGLGYVYYELGKAEKALWYDEQTLSLYSGISDPWGEAAAHIVLGMFSHSMNSERQALDHYEQAGAIIRSLKSVRLESYLLAQTGEVHEGLGEKQQALRDYMRALQLTHGKDPRGEARVLDHVGKLRVKMGQDQQALRYFDQALAITRTINDRFAESLTLVEIARVQRDRNKLAAAREKIESAIALIETLRSDVVSDELRASYFATVHQSYEVAADIIMHLHREYPTQDFDHQAFEISERARARSLIEVLKEERTGIREAIDPALLERERSLERDLDAKAERRVQLLARKDMAEVAIVTREIEEITTRYDDVRTQIKSKSPQYAALMQPQLPRLREIRRKALDEDSLLLEYMLGDERSYVWVVTLQEVSSYELPPRSQIEDVARRFYELLTANQPVAEETFEQRQTRIAEANAHLMEEAANLSKLVLAPVADKLGTKRLLIVPDGALQYIPFQALLVPRKPTSTESLAQSSQTTGNEDQVPLIVDHEIVNEPSASALTVVLSDAARRKSASNSIAVFANPVFEADDPRVKSTDFTDNQPSKTLKKIEEASPKMQVQEAFRDVGLGTGLRIPPLPASREEAEAIMSVVPWRSGLKAVGFDASRATISGTDLSKYRIVHFATHGFVDYEHPELSGLVLSLVDEQGRPQDGFLRMHDIYNLKLPVDLVVLSACNTALGKEVKGEGLIGLTRGFMYAGAGGVAASLWKVDDEATAELMKHFYEGMFKRDLTPAAALRDAQIAMWQQKRWHSPYYWAAFVLQGQYNQKEMLKPRLGVWQIAALAVLISTFPAFVFLFLRRRRRKILRHKM